MSNTQQIVKLSIFMHMLIGVGILAATILTVLIVWYGVGLLSTIFLAKEEASSATTSSTNKPGSNKASQSIHSKRDGLFTFVNKFRDLPPRRENRRKKPTKEEFKQQALIAKEEGMQERIMNVTLQSKAENKDAGNHLMKIYQKTLENKDFTINGLDSIDEEECKRAEWFINGEKEARTFIENYCRPQAKAVKFFSKDLLNSNKIQKKEAFLLKLVSLANFDNPEEQSDSFQFLKKFLLLDEKLIWYIFITEELQVNEKFKADNQKSFFFELLGAYYREMP